MIDVSERKHNVLLIILFIIMLYVPMLLINHNENAVSVLENRGFTKRPSMYETDGSLNTAFIDQYENYINDNIGLKSLAVETNIFMKYHLFHELDIPNWLLGKDNNMFYTTGGEDVRTFTGQNKFANDQLNDITTSLCNMNSYLSQKYGCKTYNLFIPNKEEIYPELYNPYVIKDSQGRMNQLTDYMAANGLSVLNLTDLFLQNKDNNLYYRCYDASHWNLNGAFLGYQELMSEIAKDDPTVKVLNESDFDISAQPFKGLTHYFENTPLLNNSFGFEDTVYHYNLKNPSDVEITENMEGVDISPDLNFYHYHNSVINNGRTLLIVGDSYIYSFIMPFFAESFTDTYFVRNTNSSKIIEIAQKVQPNIFVFEVADRVINAEYFTTYMKGYEDFIMPTVESELGIDPEIHIDSVNGRPYDSLMTYEPDENGNITVIGWAYDTVNDQKPEALIIKSADGQIITQAGFFFRKDLLSIDEKHGDCAFSFTLKVQEGDNIPLSLELITEEEQKYNAYPIEFKIQ